MKIKACVTIGVEVFESVFENYFCSFVLDKKKKLFVILFLSILFIKLYFKSVVQKIKNRKYALDALTKYKEGI